MYIPVTIVEDWLRESRKAIKVGEDANDVVMGLECHVEQFKDNYDMEWCNYHMKKVVENG